MMKLKYAQSGFTIVELLIATTVFGVVLLLATMGLIQVGKTYSKGINSSDTQGAARAIVDDVAQAIQFSGGGINLPADAGAWKVNWTTAGGDPVTSQVKFFCTQEKRYIYVAGPELTDTNHVFMSDDKGIGKGCPTPGSWPADATELFRPNMRVSKFKINGNQGSPSLYNIEVRVVFGDDDLICSPGQNNCSGNTETDFGPPDVATMPEDLACKTTVGSQFCGFSELSTSVQKRL